MVSGSPAARRSRVVLALAGDARDPAIFSGFPASLYRALSELGLDVAGLDVQLSRSRQRLLVNLMTFGFLDWRLIARSLRTDRSLRLAFRASKPRLHPSREMAAIRSAVAAHRYRGCMPVDRAISWGCEFTLPSGTDYVTFDDATIVQLRSAYAYQWMQASPDKALRRMMARQARIYSQARACCFVSHWAAASAIEDYGMPPGRVYVLGCGPNRELTPTDRDFAVPRFLFVGKDFERKNGPEVIRAFAQVRQTHPDATLDVVGEHGRIDQPGVTGHGALALDKPHERQMVNALFDRATCFVMPSKLEPAGIVFAEALAAGIGSIGTRNGGSSTIIGDAGFAIDPHDAHALIDHMTRAAQPDTAQRLAANARARAPLFTWRATAERLVRVLQLPGFDHATLAAPL
jgi:glycosyltransferase involved in cell wall biosynthesis